MSEASFNNIACALVRGGTPPQPPQPPQAQRLWKPFWLLLGGALLLRLFAAWYGHWFWRVDEIFQYLEQAHRAVFGYGTIPWEYRYDARSWLVAGIAMPPLLAAKILGVDSPSLYVSMVNSWNALLSLSIPVSAYVIARRSLGESVGRCAFVLCCFWYEFIILSPRTVAEVYSTYFFMAGVALGAGQKPGRWVAAGFLLGMALALRPHHGLLVAMVGALWLWRLPWRLSALAVAGGGDALLLWGLVDWLTLGGWWASLANYVTYVPIVYDILWADNFQWWRHLRQFVVASFGLYLLMALLSLPLARRLLPLQLLIAVPLAVYLAHGGQAYSSQEYSKMFIFLPLLWLLTAAVVVTLFGARRRRFYSVNGLILALSLAGAAGALPNLQTVFSTDDFFSTRASLRTAYEVHDLIEKKDNTVLVWATNRQGLFYGGFYALHHNIPVYVLSDNVFYEDAMHRHLWLESGVTDVAQFATHVVTGEGSALPGFDAVPLSNGLLLHINKTAPSFSARQGWVYDYINPDLNIQQRLPPRALTPYNPDL